MRTDREHCSRASPPAIRDVNGISNAVTNLDAKPRNCCNDVSAMLSSFLVFSRLEYVIMRADGNCGGVEARERLSRYRGMFNNKRSCQSDKD